jgi:hypothetical protein
LWTSIDGLGVAELVAQVQGRALDAWPSSAGLRDRA